MGYRPRTRKCLNAVLCGMLCVDEAVELCVKHVAVIELRVGECGPGSYYSTARKLCVPCDVGSYQSHSGQSTCVTCPDDMITYGRGAVYAFECCNYHCSLFRRRFSFVTSARAAVMHSVLFAGHSVCVEFLAEFCLKLIRLNQKYGNG